MGTGQDGQAQLPIEAPNPKAEMSKRYHAPQTNQLLGNIYSDPFWATPGFRGTTSYIRGWHLIGEKPVRMQVKMAKLWTRWVKFWASEDLLTSLQWFGGAQKVPRLCSHLETVQGGKFRNMANLATVPATLPQPRLNLQEIPGRTWSSTAWLQFKGFTGTPARNYIATPMCSIGPIGWTSVSTSISQDLEVYHTQGLSLFCPVHAWFAAKMSLVSSCQHQQLSPCTVDLQFAKIPSHPELLDFAQSMLSTDSLGKRAKF